MEIAKNIKYVGASDKNLDLFEGQYKVPNGMSYHSYLILDEKIAVLDTVDARFKDEWLNKIEAELSGKEPDYLVVHQCREVDHRLPKTQLHLEQASLQVFHYCFNCKRMLQIIFSYPSFTIQKNNSFFITVNSSPYNIQFFTPIIKHFTENIFTY